MFLDKNDVEMLQLHGKGLKLQWKSGADGALKRGLQDSLKVELRRKLTFRDAQNRKQMKARHDFSENRWN